MRRRVIGGAVVGFCAGAALGMPIGALVNYGIGGRRTTTAGLLAFIVVTAVAGLATGIAGGVVAPRTQRPRRPALAAILSSGLLLAYPLSTGPASYARARNWITFDAWMAIWAPPYDILQVHLPDFLDNNYGGDLQVFSFRWDGWWVALGQRHDGYVVREVNGNKRLVRLDESGN